MSDSHSVLVCLRGCRGDLREGIIARCAWLLSELCLQDKWLCMVWIPGHCAIVGNELADAAAARGCSMVQNNVECLRTSIRFCLKGLLVRNVWMHDRCKAVYNAGIDWTLEGCLSRNDAVCLARLRSGHSLELGEYRVRLGLSEDGSCRFCLSMPESVEHVFVCDAGRVMRGMLGLAGGLGDLCGRPLDSLKYWRWWRRRPPR